MLSLKNYLQPASFIGFMGSAIALLASTTIFNNAKVASLATLAGTVSLYGYVRVEKENHQERLKAELETTLATLSQLESALSDCKASENSLLGKIKPYILPDGSLLNATAQTELIESLRDNLALMTERLKGSESTLYGATNERESLKIDMARLNGQILTLESAKAEWSRKFDQMIAENSKEVESLESQVKELEGKNTKFEAQFSSIEEVAKLRANVETSALRDKLNELNQQYTRVATLYNAAVTDLKALNAEYVKEFSDLNEAVSKGLPDAFDAVLNARDQQILVMGADLSARNQPKLFFSIGEYDRANLLIKALFEHETSITLDRGEIVPYTDHTGFDVYLNLREDKAAGQAFIDALNELGNDLAVKCHCIKDLKFEVDRVNPHRIKTSMVFRKADKKEPKSAIDKLWISASEFEKIYKLLKKPMTRIMGSTGEGKGIFANLLLAIEANQTVSSFTRLHDPMNGSSEDYWQITKASKGKSQTTSAVKSFVSEFNSRLESGTSEPKTLDVFDEIDIVADNDPTVNKSFLSCSKGMRHNGMRAYLIGQSPSVGKKGWEWADLDNFNAVYFGTAIITAIDKTPALSSQSESLRKTYDKLRDFCDKQNEENDLPDEKQYRLGLLVTGGKPTFFELPSADSIPCNWSKLTTVLDSETVYNATDKTPNQDVKTASSSEQIQPVCECGKPMTSDNSRGLWKCRNSDHDVQIHGKKSRKKTI